MKNPAVAGIEQTIFSILHGVCIPENPVEYYTTAFAFVLWYSVVMSAYFTQVFVGNFS